MIWLTWRQFRGAAAMMFGALALLAVVLGVTGPGLADEYSSGLATCAQQEGGCEQWVQDFFHGHQLGFLGLALVMLLLPALAGLFWGAPLIARELETGTHRLVWNQTVTRTRWLAVKLGLTGLATLAAAGVASLAVNWWASPLDKTSGQNTSLFARMAPLMFDIRGVVPVGYAAFAFVLGVTVGMLVRRTLPAMAITLTVFAVVQVAMPLLVRPHLLPPTRANFEISTANLDGVGLAPQGPMHLTLERTVPNDVNAWVMSSRLVDKSGNTVTNGSIPLSGESGPCAMRGSQDPRAAMNTCLAEVNRLGYRQRVDYHSSDRFWTLQWIETGVYAVLALGLAGACFWRLRRLP